MQQRVLTLLLFLGQASLTLAAQDDPSDKELIGRSVRIWKEGAQALEDVPYPDRDSFTFPPRAFSTENLYELGQFLEYPWLKPAVQFSCARSATTYEDSLEAALTSKRSSVRLLSLTVLMKVSAGSSVSLQERTLRDLESIMEEASGKALLRTLRKRFSREVLQDELAQEPPGGRYKDSPSLVWAIRAVAATQQKGMLDRIGALSTRDHLAVSLAAEASLEDFEGPEANAQLVRCLLAWRYDAYVRAGRALLKRDPNLLRETLKKNQAPERDRYWQGILLGRAEDPAAVPHLCETIPKIGIIDREMFDLIERLATKEHLDQITVLPKRVREEQRERAARVVDAVMKRVGQEE